MFFGNAHSPAPVDPNKFPAPTLRVVAWELTRACPLRCRHCRAKAVRTPPPGELSLTECKALIDDIASIASPLLILTGGEPMLRDDIYEIARYATDAGFPVVAAPCGLYLNETTVEQLKTSGVKMLSLSIDGATAPVHDGLRGIDGAFEMILKAAAVAKAAEMPFQVNTTVHIGNRHELEEIAKLVKRIGAIKWDLFLLVPTGRGREMAAQELSPQAYEETLIWTREQAKHGDTPIKVTCAPHYVRIAAEEGLRGTPCLGGKSFAFIGHKGIVQICGFLDVEAGDIRVDPFSTIWRESELFNKLREPENYLGKCGKCDYLTRCSGCRARAYGMTGNYLGPEPFCAYRPPKVVKA